VGETWSRADEAAAVDFLGGSGHFAGRASVRTLAKFSEAEDRGIKFDSACSTVNQNDLRVLEQTGIRR